MRNALTFDVEEYFQVSAFEGKVTRSEWGQWPSRVADVTNRLMDILAENKVKATFFTLGNIAENHGALIRRIHSEGHEVGCHGLEHVRVYEQTPEEFRSDITRAKQIIEDCIGESVAGYRAASFSIRKDNFWAYEEMINADFRYSSSVYPVRHDLYGIPDAPRVPFKPAGESGSLVEIPASTIRLCGRNFPAAGGGFFRLYPYAVTRYFLKRINERDGTPANMYFHPWEFDPGQPHMHELPYKTKFRHYLNLDKTTTRLKRLLHDFQWSTMSDVYVDDIAG